MKLKEKYVTISQAAELVGVTRQAISRWVADKKIPSEKIGREVLIDKVALLKYHPPKLPSVIVEVGELISKAIIDEVKKIFDYSEGDKIELLKSVDGSKLNEIGKYRISVKKGDIIEQALVTVKEGKHGQGFDLRIEKIET